MTALVVASMTIAALSSCRGPEKEDVSARIKRSEEEAVRRDGERECASPITIYNGSIAVSSRDYLHSVAHGKDFVDEPIDGLDKVVSKSTRVRFTLSYPFERSFNSEVKGEITLRRTIDAIRAGFRKMYEGTTQRDVPGMHNKDVTGPYGSAFHAIDDLVIETLELCADDTLLITIGS
jgi:hypothetical protein